MRKTVLLALLLPSLTCATVIEEDKVKHVAATYLISGTTSIILSDTDLTKEERFWYSFFTGMGVGLAKEIYDSQQEGNRFDERDMVADFVGSAFGATSFEVYNDWRASAFSHGDVCGIELSKKI